MGTHSRHLEAGFEMKMGFRVEPFENTAQTIHA